MVKMVLGSSDSQASSVTTLADNYTAGFESLISAFDNLANEDKLSGDAYTNIKSYGSGVVAPLVKAFILLADAAKADVQKLPDEYRAQVGGEDLDEETLTAQISAYATTIEANQTSATSLGKTEPMTDAVQTSINSLNDAVASDTAAKAELEEKLRKLLEYNAQSSGFFNDIAALESAVTTGISQLQAGVTSFNGTFTLPSQKDLEWTKAVNSQWEKRDFYNSLPKDIRDIITINDIEATDDGFFIITKPISEILKEKGKTTVIIDGQSVSVDEIYDDWFIYGIKGNEGYSYSALKMRELDDSQGGHGVSISFISTDITKLFEFSDDSETIQDTDYFYKEFQRVVSDKDQSADRILLDYFKDTKSDASYLIADLYTSKVIQENGSNTINSQPLDNILAKIKKDEERLSKGTGPMSEQGLSNEIRKLRRIPSYLEELNQKAGYDIYNPETGDITVKDPNNLTHYERQAILAVSTGNVNYNSFAAEVEFHADAVDDWKSSVPFIGSKWKESAIRADMGLGEENESGNFDRYYNLEDDSVERQKEEHGEK
ncbi:T7SS effector LXG polymorphic toxin [Streptococcus ferus]|uniref:Membrane protein n=1 Tax=Streptococcus ferus TaxID=1345 RepID=A0A2X3VS46_9STRE|nr:T7SS effector LXG polymorphic toxin [Streptococcus ferus]SQF40545.1 membrane protein [Streptococcus ferus]